MENKKRKTKVTVKRNILNNLNGTLYTYHHESMSVFFSQTNIKSLLITFWRSDNPATACCCWKLRCRGSASWPLFYRGGRYRWWCWLMSWRKFMTDHGFLCLFRCGSCCRFHTFLRIPQSLCSSRASKELRKLYVGIPVYQCDLHESGHHITT